MPLSFGQERLWFIDQLEGSVQYHIPLIRRLKGNVNVDALTFAFRNIINRHEVLQTVIKEIQGEAFQYIKEKNLWQLDIINDTKYQQDPQTIQQYVNSLIQLPFDLLKDDMLRATLIRLGPDEHVLVVVIHHIASDGWSIPIVVKELTELYAAYIEDRSPKLGSLPIQYADYAFWQRKYLQGEVLEKKLTYWKQKLEGVTVLQLPTDYKRPDVSSTRGASIRFTLTKELSEQIQQFTKEHKSTVYMTLLAAFKVLLYRYSGQQDICVGSPIANRTQHEVEGLIGFFVNTLALRSEINGEATFTELLQQVKAYCP
ncbi:MAG: condensation domain-containing protein [Chitinophagaceae bacterium]